MNLQDRVWQFKARLLRRTLRLTCGNVKEAAKLLGIDRTAFYVTAKRAGLDIVRWKRSRLTSTQKAKRAAAKR